MVISNGLVGFSIFPILTIVLEEMLSRLDPTFLVIISLVLTFLHQSVTVISITIYSPIYADQDRDKSLKYLKFTFGLYLVMVFLFFYALHLAKKDNLRKSVMMRFKIKEDVVKGNEFEERKIPKVEKLTGEDDGEMVIKDEIVDINVEEIMKDDDSEDNRGEENLPVMDSAVYKKPFDEIIDD